MSSTWCNITKRKGGGGWTTGPQPPERDNLKAKSHAPVHIPKNQTMPTQELGTRISKALPYTFFVFDLGVATISSSTQLAFSFSLENTGKAGAPFVLFDVLNLDTATPRNYAVEAGKSIHDIVTIPTGDSDGEYAIVLMGPNGFVREFAGSSTWGNAEKCSSGLKMSLSYDVSLGDVVVVVDATDALLESTAVGIVDNAYGSLTVPLILDVKKGTVRETRVHVGDVGHWYDITAGVLPGDAALLTAEDVTRVLDKKDDEEEAAVNKRARGARNVATRSTGTDSCFVRRFMGRMETGEDSISDPAMGSGVKGLWGKSQSHPELSEKIRALKRVTTPTVQWWNADGQHKDAARDEGL